MQLSSIKEKNVGGSWSIGRAQNQCVGVASGNHGMKEALMSYGSKSHGLVWHSMKKKKKAVL